MAQAASLYLAGRYGALMSYVCSITAQAMIATADLHDGEEVSKRVIPSVAPLAVDPVQDVRHHTLLALDKYCALLKEHVAKANKAAEANGASQQEGHAAGALWPPLPSLPPSPSRSRVHTCLQYTPGTLLLGLHPNLEYHLDGGGPR